MTDGYDEAMYYPVVDPLQIGRDSDIFAAIPYLREFRLSKPRVIYKPPSIVDLRAAGAIPVEAPFAYSGGLPTITLAAETAPYQGNFREVVAATACSRFLCPPEREGLEAAAEFLQRGVREASDQEYWSDEYWKSLQADGLDSRGSVETDAGLQDQPGAAAMMTTTTTTAAAAAGSQGRRTVGKQKCGFVNARQRRSERVHYSIASHAQRSPVEKTTSAHPSLRGSAAPKNNNNISRSGGKTRGDREGRLSPHGVSGGAGSRSVQQQKNVGGVPLTNVRSKAAQQKPKMGLEKGSPKRKSNLSKGKYDMGPRDVFVNPSLDLRNELLNASRPRHMSMNMNISSSSSPLSASSSLRESGGLNDSMHNRLIETRIFMIYNTDDNGGGLFSRGLGSKPTHSATTTPIPTVTATPMVSPKPPCAGHKAKDSQTHSLLASAAGGVNINTVDGGRSNSQNIIPANSAKDNTVSQDISGVLATEKAPPDVEVAEGTSTLLQRRDVEGSRCPISDVANVKFSANSETRLRSEKPIGTKCCMLM